MRGDTEMIQTQREALGIQSVLSKPQTEAEAKTQQCRAHMNGRGTNAVSGIRPVLGVSSMPFGSSTCLWHCWMHGAVSNLQHRGGCWEQLVCVVGSAIPGSKQVEPAVNQAAKQDAPETHSPRAGPDGAALLHGERGCRIDAAPACMA